MSVTDLPALISEAEAYAKFGHLLADKELRRARQARIIGYYKRGQNILYREDELLAFIEARLQGSYVPPCPKKNSGSGNTGSTKSQDHHSGTLVGMTPELERLGADLLRRQTSKKPRSDSPRSSSARGQAKIVSLMPSR